MSPAGVSPRDCPLVTGGRVSAQPGPREADHAPGASVAVCHVTRGHHTSQPQETVSQGDLETHEIPHWRQEHTTCGQTTRTRDSIQFVAIFTLLRRNAVIHSIKCKVIRTIYLLLNHYCDIKLI